MGGSGKELVKDINKDVSSRAFDSFVAGRSIDRNNTPACGVLERAVQDGRARMVEEVVTYEDGRRDHVSILLLGNFGVTKDITLATAALTLGFNIAGEVHTAMGGMQDTTMFVHRRLSTDLK